MQEGPGQYGPPGMGPSPGAGGGAGGGTDLPDYMRVSMSRMVAGWSAPNARHGALSGFNDVWSHRNVQQGGRPPPGGPGGGMMWPPPPPPGAGGGQYMAALGGPHGAGGGGGPDYYPGGRDEGSYGAGGGGGGPRGTGFEGMSLAEVLASKPKKEVPTFTKKRTG